MKGDLSLDCLSDNILISRVGPKLNTVFQSKSGNRLPTCMCVLLILWIDMFHYVSIRLNCALR